MNIEETMKFELIKQYLSEVGNYCDSHDPKDYASALTHINHIKGMIYGAELFFTLLKDDEADKEKFCTDIAFTNSVYLKEKIDYVVQSMTTQLNVVNADFVSKLNIPPSQLMPLIAFEKSMRVCLQRIQKIKMLL